MSEPFVLVEARGPSMIGEVRSLFREYAAILGIDLCFQQFDQELANLPGDYAPPAGRLYLARVDQESVGCVALRPISPDTGEMKRLYVRPTHRGERIGQKLVEKTIEEARLIGYRRILLDTLPLMTNAIALYRSMGFTETEAYRDNPVEGALFMRYEINHTPGQPVVDSASQS